MYVHLTDKKGINSDYVSFPPPKKKVIKTRSGTNNTFLVRPLYPSFL